MDSLGNVKGLKILLKNRIEWFPLERDEKIVSINLKATTPNTFFYSERATKESALPQSCFCSIDEFVETIASKALSPGNKELNDLFKVKLFEITKVLNQKFNQLVHEINQIILKQVFPNNDPIEFFEDFSNGVLNDDTQLRTRVCDLITKWDSITGYEFTKETIEEYYKRLEIKFNSTYKNFEDEIHSSISSIIFPFQKSIQYCSTVVNTNRAMIPCYHGIDCSPTGKSYASVSVQGELVVRECTTNSELFRTKLTGRGSTVLDHVLWSPSGQQLLFGESNSKNIFIYNDTFSNIKKIINQNFNGFLSSVCWIDENKIAVGYGPIGVLKIFFLQFSQMIYDQKLSSAQITALKVSKNLLFMGDYLGTLRCFNVESMQVLWVAQDWHQNKTNFQFIQVSFDGKKIATGSSDCFVKILNIETQVLVLCVNIGSYVNGLAWLPGDQFLVALGAEQRLLVVDPAKQTILLNYTKVPEYCCSLGVAFNTMSIFIGDDEGQVHCYKLVKNCRQKIQTIKL